MSGLFAIKTYNSSETDSSSDESYQHDEDLSLLKYTGGDRKSPVVEQGENEPKRRKIKEKTDEPNSRHKKKQCSMNTEHLPLPDEVKAMFSDDIDVDKTVDHQGRIRSFLHEAGNWPTYVYVPIKVSSELEDLVVTLLHCIPTEYNMQPMETPHLSVSRTVTLKYHWIRPFTESLTSRLAALPRFVCAFGKPHIYVNDEATRSFISLTIGQGVEELKHIVKEVDLALEEFNLPSFYKPPSFHVSIGWCLGDLTKKITTEILRDLEIRFLENFSSMTSVWTVASLESKIGNKYFNFPLS